MNPLIAPDWVAQEAAVIERENDKSEIARLERLLLEKSVKADGGEYRKDLARWIAIGVEATDSIGVIGTVEPIRENDESVGVRFTLTKRGLPNRSRDINIFFRACESIVRCFSESEPEEQFHFCGDDAGNLFLRVNSSKLTAQKAADYLVQREYTRLKG